MNEMKKTITDTNLKINLVFDQNRCVNNITNILLIDSTVNQYQKLIDGVNENTLAIVYSRFASPLELFEILNKEELVNVKRIGIVFDNDLLDSKYFIGLELFFIDTDILPETNEEDYSLGLQIILKLIRTKQLTNIDFLACNSLLSEKWRTYYNLLFQKTSVIVGASNNTTGNIAYGSDWIMESTHEDIKYVYWTDAISNYSSTLMGQGISNSTDFKAIDNQYYPFIATSGSCIFLLNTVNKTLTQQRSFYIDSTSYGSTSVPLIDFTGGYIGPSGSSWVLNGNGFTINLTGLNSSTTFYSIVRSSDNTLFTVNNIVIVGNLSTLTLKTFGGIIVDQGQKYVRMNNCYIHSSSNLTITNWQGTIAGNTPGWPFGEAHINNCGVSVDGNFVIINKAGGIVGHAAALQGECWIDGCYVYTKGNLTIDNYAGGIAGNNAGSYSYYQDYDSVNNGFDAKNCFIKSIGTTYVNLGAGGIVGSYAADGGRFSLSNCAVLSQTLNMSYQYAGGIVGGTPCGNNLGANGLGTVSKCAVIPNNLVCTGYACGAIVGLVDGESESSMVCKNMRIYDSYTSVELPLFGSQTVSTSNTHWENCYTVSSSFGSFGIDQTTLTNCAYNSTNSTYPIIGAFNITIFNDVDVFTNPNKLSNWNTNWIMPITSTKRPTLKVFENSLWIDTLGSNILNFTLTASVISGNNVRFTVSKNIVSAAAGVSSGIIHIYLVQNNTTIKDFYFQPTTLSHYEDIIYNPALGNVTIGTNSSSELTSDLLSFTNNANNNNLVTFTLTNTIPDIRVLNKSSEVSLTVTKTSGNNLLGPVNIFLKQGTELIQTNPYINLLSTYLTSNTSPSTLVAYSSSIYGTPYASYKAFNGIKGKSSDNFGWHSQTNQYLSELDYGASSTTGSTVVDGSIIRGEWIEIGNTSSPFDNVTEVVLYGSSVLTSNRFPRHVMVCGSNDRTTWTKMMDSYQLLNAYMNYTEDIDYITNTERLLINHAGNYKYLRLIIIKLRATDYPCLIEVEYKKASPDFMFSDSETSKNKNYIYNPDLGNFTISTTSTSSNIFDVLTFVNNVNITYAIITFTLTTTDSNPIVTNQNSSVSYTLTKQGIDLLGTVTVYLVQGSNQKTEYFTFSGSKSSESKLISYNPTWGDLKIDISRSVSSSVYDNLTFVDTNTHVTYINPNIELLQISNILKKSFIYTLEVESTNVGRQLLVTKVSGEFDINSPSVQIHYLTFFAPNIYSTKIKGLEPDTTYYVKHVKYNYSDYPNYIHTYSAISEFKTLSTFTGINMSSYNLVDEDFSGEILPYDFSYKDLTGVNFFNANLSGSNLSYANLTDIRLNNNTIIGPLSINTTSMNNINYKIVTETVTSNKYLIGKNVNLSGINLSGMDLTGANLTGIKLSSTTKIGPFTIIGGTTGTAVGGTTGTAVGGTTGTAVGGTTGTAVGGTTGTAVGGTTAQVPLNITLGRGFKIITENNDENKRYLVGPNAVLKGLSAFSVENTYLDFSGIDLTGQDLTNVLIKNNTLGPLNYWDNSFVMEGDTKWTSQLGNSVICNLDGSIIAYSERKNNKSIVHIYKNNNGWVKYGNSIFQTSPNYSFGESMCFSNDGNTLIISDYKWENGSVLIYKCISNVWTLQQTIARDMPTFGKSTSLSGDGKYLLIGAPNNEVGNVLVYEYILGEYIENRIFSCINPINSIGHKVTISRDGNTIAFSGKYGNSGCCIIYTKNGTIWINSETIIENGVVDIPYSISISSSGDRIAIGYMSYSNYKGCVFIYDKSSIEWIKTATIQGINDYSYFSNNTALLSSDANHLIVSSSPNNGEINFYKFENGSWNKKYLFNNIESNANYGRNCAISENGETIVFGSPGNFGKVEIFTKSSNTPMNYPSLSGWNTLTTNDEMYLNKINGSFDFIFTLTTTNLNANVTNPNSSVSYTLSKTGGLLNGTVNIYLLQGSVEKVEYFTFSSYKSSESKLISYNPTLGDLKIDKIRTYSSSVYDNFTFVDTDTHVTYSNPVIFKLTTTLSNVQVSNKTTSISFTVTKTFGWDLNGTVSIYLTQGTHKQPTPITFTGSELSKTQSITYDPTKGAVTIHSSSTSTETSDTLTFVNDAVITYSNPVAYTLTVSPTSVINKSTNVIFKIVRSSGTSLNGNLSVKLIQNGSVIYTFYLSGVDSDVDSDEITYNPDLGSITIDNINSVSDDIADTITFINNATITYTNPVTFTLKSANSNIFNQTPSTLNLTLSRPIDSILLGDVYLDIYQGAVKKTTVLFNNTSDKSVSYDITNYSYTDGSVFAQIASQTSVKDVIQLENPLQNTFTLTSNKSIVTEKISTVSFTVSRPTNSSLNGTVSVYIIQNQIIKSILEFTATDTTKSHQYEYNYDNGQVTIGTSTGSTSQLDILTFINNVSITYKNYVTYSLRVRPSVCFNKNTTVEFSVVRTSGWGLNGKITVYLKNKNLSSPSIPAITPSFEFSGLALDHSWETFEYNPDIHEIEIDNDGSLNTKTSSNDYITFVNNNPTRFVLTSNPSNVFNNTTPVTFTVSKIPSTAITGNVIVYLKQRTNLLGQVTFTSSDTTKDVLVQQVYNIDNGPIVIGTTSYSSNANDFICFLNNNPVIFNVSVNNGSAVISNKQTTLKFVVQKMDENDLLGNVTIKLSQNGVVKATYNFKEQEDYEEKEFIYNPDNGPVIIDPSSSSDNPYDLITFKNNINITYTNPVTFKLTSSVPSVSNKVTKVRFNVVITTPTTLNGSATFYFKQNGIMLEKQILTFNNTTKALSFDFVYNPLVGDVTFYNYTQTNLTDIISIVNDTTIEYKNNLTFTFSAQHKTVTTRNSSITYSLACNNYPNGTVTLYVYQNGIRKKDDYLQDIKYTFNTSSIQTQNKTLNFDTTQGQISIGEYTVTDNSDKITIDNSNAIITSPVAFKLTVLSNQPKVNNSTYKFTLTRQSGINIGAITFVFGDRTGYTQSVIFTNNTVNFYVAYWRPMDGPIELKESTTNGIDTISSFINDAYIYNSINATLTTVIPNVSVINKSTSIGFKVTLRTTFNLYGTVSIYLKQNGIVQAYPLVFSETITEQTQNIVYDPDLGPITIDQISSKSTISGDKLTTFVNNAPVIYMHSFWEIWFYKNARTDLQIGYIDNGLNLICDESDIQYTLPTTILNSGYTIGQPIQTINTSSTITVSGAEDILINVKINGLDKIKDPEVYQLMWSGTKTSGSILSYSEAIGTSPYFFTGQLLIPKTDIQTSLNLNFNIYTANEYMRSSNSICNFTINENIKPLSLTNVVWGQSGKILQATFNDPNMNNPNREAFNISSYKITFIANANGSNDLNGPIGPLTPIEITPNNIVFDVKTSKYVVELKGPSSSGVSTGLSYYPGYSYTFSVSCKNNMNCESDTVTYNVPILTNGKPKITMTGSTNNSVSGYVVVAYPQTCQVSLFVCSMVSSSNSNYDKKYYHLLLKPTTHTFTYVTGSTGNYYKCDFSITCDGLINDIFYSVSIKAENNMGIVYIQSYIPSNFNMNSNGVQSSIEVYTGTQNLTLDVINSQISGRIIDISGCSINSLDLTGVDLSKAILKNVSTSNLTGTFTLPKNYKLFDGYIFGPYVNLSSVESINLTNTEYILLSDVDLSGAQFSPNLKMRIKSQDVFAYEPPINISCPFGGYIVSPYVSLEGADLRFLDYDQVPVSSFQNTRTGPSLLFNSDTTLPNGFYFKGISSPKTYIVGPGVDLSSVDFAGTSVTDYVDFTGIDLSGVNLTNSKLDFVKSAKNKFSDTSYCKYKSLTNDGFLIEKNIQLVNIVFGKETYKDYDMSGIIFKGSDMSNSSFQNVTFTNCDFTDTITNKIATMYNSQSSGGMKPTNIVLVQGVNSLFHKYAISNGYLIGMDIDFTSCNLSNTDIRYVNISKSIILNTKFGYNTNYTDENTKLPYGYRVINGYIFGKNLDCSSYNLQLPNTIFDLSDLDLSGSNFSNVDFKNTILSGTIFINCVMTNIKSGFINGNDITLRAPVFSISSRLKFVSGYILGPYVNLVNANFKSINFSFVDEIPYDFTGVKSGGIQTNSDTKLPIGVSIFNGYLLAAGVDLTNVNLTNSIVNNFSDVDLTNATLYRVKSSNLTYENNKIPKF
jgi:uncharacterized protein YjbI with pentapeptide repeats